jgi:hypothetical protein
LRLGPAEAILDGLKRVPGGRNNPRLRTAWSETVKERPDSLPPRRQRFVSGLFQQGETEKTK